MRELKIYLATAVQGDRCQIVEANKLIEWLKALGHDVINDHVALETVEESDRVLAKKMSITGRKLTASDIWSYCIDQSIMRKDLDLIIAECSGSSHGVGMEITFAMLRTLINPELKKIPIVVMHNGAQHSGISGMISGVPERFTESKPEVFKYDDFRHIRRILSTYFDAYFK